MHPAFAFIFFVTSATSATLAVPLENQLFETIFTDHHHGEILDDGVHNSFFNETSDKEVLGSDSDSVPLDSTFVEQYFHSGTAEYIPALDETDNVPVDENISFTANDSLSVYSVSIEIPFESADSLEYWEPLESKEELVNYNNTTDNCSHCMEFFQNSTGNDTKLVGCMCAIFTSMHPTEYDAPLTSRIFNNISCHQNVPSEEVCHSVCISVAKLYNVLQDDMVCASVLGHARDLTAFLQTKLCEEDTEWEYTGVSSSSPVCCHMGLSVPC